MLYSTKNRDNLEEMIELASLQSHKQALRLKDAKGKRNNLDDMTIVFNPVTRTIKAVSEDVTKTTTETSKWNSKALANSNDKLSELRNDRGILAPYSLSLLSKVTNSEHTSQFKLVTDPDSHKFH